MKKLSIVSGVLLLVLCTAGFASAAPPTPVCTATACNETGTLYFVAADGSTITAVEGVQLVLKQVTPATDQPANFWTGTLTIPTTTGLPAAVTTTYNLSAIKSPDMSDDPHLFRDIAGIDSTGDVILTAEGRNNTTVRNSGKNQYGFGFHGKIYDGATFVGSFHGPLSPTTSTTP
jgi:hypothetical protein